MYKLISTMVVTVQKKPVKIDTLKWYSDQILTP